MSDLEFDVLDELYFVVSYQHIKEELALEDETLKTVLQQLLEKGWIRCYLSASEEALEDEIDFENKYQTYYYLASKKGLLAHNGRS
ncbi:MAG: hypothetical protein ACLFUB_11250 [Cyclobacteriaceae bacterium]